MVAVAVAVAAATDHSSNPGMQQNQSTSRKVAIVLFSVAAWVFVPMGTALADCLSSTGRTAISVCQKELRKDPGNNRVRIALAEALSKAERHQEAVALLKNGLKSDPNDRQMKKMLRVQESILEEQAWTEKQRAKRAKGGTAKIDPKTKLNIIRCTKLSGRAALKACNEGLKKLSDNPELLTGKADVLLSMNRISESILVYKKAKKIQPGNRKISEKLRLAESERRIFASRCFSLEGSQALTACKIALLKGASDEFRIQRRRGDLLVAAGNSKDGLKAYKTAQRIKPGDTKIKQKIALLEAEKNPAIARNIPPSGNTTRPKPTSEPKTATPSEKPGSETDPLPGQIRTPIAVTETSFSNAPLRPGVTF
ncbi:MAG: tetratricopeptide repeat protein [Gammaproteobacteria bacterium]|nr:tetratricopeptide repeat protein [Gammaproteobacteria bacterium]